MTHTPFPAVASWVVLVPESVAVASITSEKIVPGFPRQVPEAPHAGAVSWTEYAQVSPWVLFFCSVVTAIPSTKHWTGEVAWPRGVFVTTRFVTVKSGSRFWTVPVQVKVAPGA
jgi:hypothetical protein